MYCNKINKQQQKKNEYFNLNPNPIIFSKINLDSEQIKQNKEKRLPPEKKYVKIFCTLQENHYSHQKSQNFKNKITFCMVEDYLEV